MDLLIIIVFGFALMWLFVVLPQRRRQSTHNSMISGLTPGDYVVTAGGLYGTVTEIGEEDLGLEVAPDVEVRVAKRSIGAVIPPEEIEDVDDLEQDEEPAPEAESPPDAPR
ncbi:MAG: preprotein translocase subunit YajC [Gaiellaceae bacterium]